MDLNEFKKRMDNATANIVNVTGFSDDLIKKIQKKEESFDIVLVVQSEFGKAGLLSQGTNTGTLYVEYIGDEDGQHLFRL
jgi:hypothetical protein